MSEVVKSVVLFLTVTQFLLGMLGNGFIGLVNGSNWFKNKRISLSDFITTHLALSRILLLWTLLADCVLRLFFYKEYNNGVAMQVIDVFWTFTNHLSIWLATCLGVLYCLKIASFSHPTFLWLKWRVSRVVVWMQLGALLSSCVSTTSLICEFKAHSVLRGIEHSVNATEHFRKQKDKYEEIHVLGTLWNLPPLVVCLASNILLVLSLGKHTQRMQHNRTGTSDPSTEAHRKAIRMILSFLCLFLLYFLVFLITTSSYFLPGAKEANIIGEAFIMFYPSCHSFIFILGNSKLKQSFVELLCCESGHPKPGPKGPLPP